MSADTAAEIRSSVARASQPTDITRHLSDGESAGLFTSHFLSILGFTADPPLTLCRTLIEITYRRVIRGYYRTFLRFKNHFNNSFVSEVTRKRNW